MKTLLLSFVLLLAVPGFANQTCEDLSLESFLEELVQIKSEHAEMRVEDIHSDFQNGVAFIEKTFGKESAQYQAAMTFVSETEGMVADEFQIVEDLRIQIIPIMGPESIYKEHQKTLMRKCRKVLLAALILT